MPGGLAIRPIGTDEASRRAVWDASVEAFRDHRGEWEATEEDWLHFVGDLNRDPPCGSSPSTATRSRAASWVRSIQRRTRTTVGNAGIHRRGLDPRGRGGDAAWPVPCSPGRSCCLRDHGMTSAYLGVDGLNPNQAMTLYSSLGFEIANATIDWSKPLPAWTDVPAPPEAP